MTAVDPAVVGDVTAVIVRRPYRRRGCIWAAICSICGDLGANTTKQFAAERLADHLARVHGVVVS